MNVERQQGITEQMSLSEQVGSVIRPVDFGDAGSGSETHEEQQAFTAVDQQRALTQDLMERVVLPSNLNTAYKRVKANKGSAGIDAIFSAGSHGFRPGRSAYTALKQAEGHVAAGHAIVVDMDLEKFFDRVNHDMLMSRLHRWIGDKRLLRIIRRFLEAGRPPSTRFYAR